MANQKHLGILMQGMPAWNKWRRKNLDIIFGLVNADLSFAGSSDVNFFGAVLNGAKYTVEAGGFADFGSILIRSVTREKRCL